MAYRFTLGDVTFLGSTGGDGALAQAATLRLRDSSLIGDLTRLRRTAGEHTAAVAETVRLRRRAADRWGPGFEHWLLTDEALQQSPPPPVAAHRAARIARWLRTGPPTGSPDSGVHDVTCSIGADLAALLGAGILTVGSDLDPVRLAMARHNLTVAGLPARLARADARTVTTRGLLRYADPARRDVTGRRISSADTIPPVTDLDAADPAHPAVLRLPPGIDYERLDRPGEIEIVSLDGTVREAVSWPPELATGPPIRRRASILAGDGMREQVTDDEPDDVAVTAVGRYLVDPDPAVVRAHLVRHYAARHRLALLDPHLAYLTGSAPPAGIRAFHVLEAARFSERTVRDWVRRDRVGTLEIKQRGTPVIPDELRRRVRPAGDRRVQRTLIIARIGRDAQAFWCESLPAAAR